MFFFFQSRSSIQKNYREKEKDFVKMRIQRHQFFSVLFIPIADFCLFVANRTLVKSNHSMNVFKPRKRKSKTLTGLHVCVRLFVCACVSLLWFLFVFVLLFVFIGLFVFVCQCLSVLFALSNCFRLQKKRIGHVEAVINPIANAFKFFARPNSRGNEIKKETLNERKQERKKMKKKERKKERKEDKKGRKGEKKKG